jgi:hypothetical protein
MKIIFSLVVCGLSLAKSMISISPALAKNEAGGNIHIDQSRQFPETRWANADHYIRLHVSSNSEPLTELRLQITNNLRFNVNQVEVFDLRGQKIPAVVTDIVHSQNNLTERLIRLAFASPVNSSTQFDIRIKNVKKALISQPSTYVVFSKLGDSNQEHLIGEAYFRSY